MRTESKRNELAAATLTWCLALLPLSAQAQTPSPSADPSPKAGPSTARPAHMPCRIVERGGPFGTPSGTLRGVYTLYYRKDGRLATATRRTATNACQEWSDCQLGTEKVEARYQYDTQGRLVGVVEPVGEKYPDHRMSITYSAAGKPTRYKVVEPPHEGHWSKYETVLTTDASGKPSSGVMRGSMLVDRERKVQTTSLFYEVKEPFASSPTVWPYAGDELYVGWGRHVSAMRVEGLDGTSAEMDILTFDEQGRIRTVLKNREYRGTTVRVLEFRYECADEQAAEDVDASKIK